MDYFFFVIVEYIVRIEVRRSTEFTQLVERISFNSFLGEDSFNILVKLDVVDQFLSSRHFFLEFSLQELEFLIC